MPLCIPEKCHRGLSSCKPLASIESYEYPENTSKPQVNPETGMPYSFICVGKNDGSEVREDIPSDDPYTLCWHNSMIDERSFYDKRDLTDTASVILQALSAIENQISEL